MVLIGTLNVAAYLSLNRYPQLRKQLDTIIPGILVIHNLNYGLDARTDAGNPHRDRQGWHVHGCQYYLLTKT